MQRPTTTPTPPAKIAKPGPTTPPDTGAVTGQETGALAGMTTAHNDLRATVGTPALTWSNDLGRWAQAWANQLAANGCQLAHRPSNADKYGENLYWGSGGPKTAAAVAAVWAAEKASYDHASNSCAQGQICGHYTQMIWSSTRYVGCGRATCNGGEVWVCNYDPQGNFLGQSPY